MGYSNIKKIIAHQLLGNITPEEENLLQNWLAESEENKARYDRFMKKSDLTFLLARICKEAENDDSAVAEAYDSGTETPENEDAETQERGFWTISISAWMKASIAACVLLLMGFYAWQSYDKVEAPNVPKEYYAVMQQSKMLGRSDADVKIIGGRDASEPMVSEVNSVADESGISRIVELFMQNNDASSDKGLKAEIVTHHDKEFWLTLPDGTRVHLNYNSSLTYPLSFSGKNRDVELEGEAYFFVAKDHRHPFIVHTRYGDVKEYGTEFVINTRYDSKNTTGVWGVQGKGLSVVLVNGSISIIPEGGKETMMKPNDLAVVSEGSTQPHIKQVDTEPFTSWNTGTFSFDNCPLDRLIDVISRWHGMTVDIRNKQAMHKGFTGELDRYGDIHSQLNAIGNITGAKIYVDDHTIVIE